MIADKTVQRILTVLGVVVIEAGILRIGLIIDFLSVSYQVVDVMNAIAVVHRVGFNKGRVLEVALAHPERAGVLSTTTGTTLHRTRIDRVFTTMISLINILGQRVSHTCQAKSLCKERQHGVFLNLVGQQHATGRNRIVQHMDHTIGNGVVALYHARVLIDIIDQFVVVIRV